LLATEPLGDWGNLLPHDRAVSDSRFVVNYYRLSADRRLIFGGGERYTPSAPDDIKSFAQGHMLRVFPHLRNRRIDYAWGGIVSVTRSRMPHFGRSGNFFFAHGYSGLGVALSSFAGVLLCEAMRGTAERFDLMARIAPRAFPGGARLRDPLYVLGMMWYALRDRL
jgi:gamma-glutamylputrescine oxidase